MKKIRAAMTALVLCLWATSMSAQTVTAEWDAPLSGVPDGYRVYRDKVALGTTTDQRFLVPVVYGHTHTIDVTAFNSAGESMPLSGQITVPPPTPPEMDVVVPEVSITYTINEPKLLLTVEATDDSGVVVRIVVYENDKLVASCAAARCVVERPFKRGVKTYEGQAWDAAGNTAVSSVTVKR
jgi:hypothetical protein